MFQIGRPRQRMRPMRRLRRTHARQSFAHQAGRLESFPAAIAEQDRRIERAFAEIGGQEPGGVDVRANEIGQATGLCGKSLGTSRSTSFPADTAAWSAKNCEAAGKPAITVSGTEDTSAARMQLKQGRIVAGVQGSETLPYAMKLEPNTYKPIGEPFVTPLEGIAFAKSNPRLRDAVLGALNKLIANGTYAAIVAKWNLQSSAVKRVTLNATPAR